MRLNQSIEAFFIAFLVHESMSDHQSWVHQEAQKKHNMTSPRVWLGIITALRRQLLNEAWNQQICEFGDEISGSKAN